MQAYTTVNRIELRDAYGEIHGRWMSVHAELGVECFQVLLVQLQHILNVEYLHQHTHMTKTSISMTLKLCYLYHSYLFTAFYSVTVLCCPQA